MLDPDDSPPTDDPEAALAAPAHPLHPLWRLLKIVVVLLIVGVAVTAFASWYWTGDWTWMFRPR